MKNKFYFYTNLYIFIGNSLSYNKKLQFNKVLRIKFYENVIKKTHTFVTNNLISNIDFGFRFDKLSFTKKGHFKQQNSNFDPL